MEYLGRTSTVRAGTRIRRPDGAAEGTLGLFVAGAASRIFGLSLLAAAPAGSEPQAWLANRWRAMGKSRPLIASDSDGPRLAASLLALIPMSERLQVSAAMPGVANVRGVVDPFDVGNERLFLATSTPVHLGKVEEVATRLFLRDRRSGQLLGYDRAVRVECPHSLPPGSGGAAVVTERGNVLGLAAGFSDGSLLVAPLRAALVASSLYPLGLEAGAHNEHALALARQERLARIKAASPQVQPRSPALFKVAASKRLIAEAKIRSLVEKIERMAA